MDFFSDRVIVETFLENYAGVEDCETFIVGGFELIWGEINF